MRESEVRSFGREEPVVELPAAPPPPAEGDGGEIVLPAISLPVHPYIDGESLRNIAAQCAAAAREGFATAAREAVAEAVGELGQMAKAAVLGAIAELEDLAADGAGLSPRRRSSVGHEH